MRPVHCVCIWLMLFSSYALAQLNPVPFVNQPVLPTTVAPGGPAFTLTVNGSGFVSGATVNWNGSPRSTTFISATQLTASILATDITSPSTAIITVTNPAPGGGISNYVYLSVTNPIAEVALVRLDESIGLLIAGVNDGYVNPGNLATGDFNGDGKIDVVLGEGTGGNISGGSGGAGAACVYLGLGNGTFQTPACYFTADHGYDFRNGASPCLIAVADVDGDGKLDLVCVSTDPYFPGITVFLGNGDGTFQTTGKTSAFGAAQAIAGVGDFNRDGKLDLVIISGGTKLTLGNGDGTFATPTTISSEGSSAAVGDFNRDGNLDVVITGSQMQLFLGNGDGTFQAPQTISTIVGPISAADVNNDGILDLVVQNDPSSPMLSVLLGNGDGTFQAPQNTVDSNASFITPVLGDMNGDDKLDFIDFFIEQTSALLSLQFGSGNGTFQAPVTFSVPGLPTTPALALGDFNGDGMMDVAAFTTNSGNNTQDFSTFIQGIFPVANIAPSNLNFNEVPIGQNASLPVTLTNTGNTALTITSISLTGTNVGDFSQTNNCGTSLAANASCTINVKFTSKGGGALTATLAIADNNAFGSPQTVPITATSPDFSITANTASSVTISPGQTATYGITVAGVQKFVGTVRLSCSGGPPGSNCTVVPGSAAVEAPVTATVTVSTVPSGTGSTKSPFFPPYNRLEYLRLGWFALLLCSLLLSLVGWRQQPRLRRIGLRAIFLVCAGLALASCGGGGSGGGSPTGAYTVTVTGTFTSNGVTVTHTLNLTLNVQ